MLDSWSIQRLLVYQMAQDSFTVTTAQVSYTIGPAGNVSTTRPTKIDYAFVRDSSNIDTPLEVITEQSVYDGIVMKSTGNTYPYVLFYDGGFVSGLGTLKLYPAPSASLTVFLDSWKQLQQFTSVTQTLSLPPGYQRAIETNLALELAPGTAEITQRVLDNAKEAKAAIKSVNLPAALLQLDAGIVGVRSRNNIITGP